jgi:osmoprotectant transport system permease protein
VTSVAESATAVSQTATRVRRRVPLFVPVLVVLIVVAVALFIARADLDAIEMRVLNWDNILTRFREHLVISLATTAIVILIAVPGGILLSRRFASRIQGPFLAIAGAAQTIPSIGLIVLLALLLGTGVSTAIIAIVAFSVLPLLRNTLIAIMSCPPAVAKAASGMGMSPTQVLFRVELPLGVPVILAGVRTVLVLNVGTAALATLIGAGGFGSLIDAGLSLNRTDVVVVGSALTAALALSLDWFAALLQTALSPRGTNR